MAKFNAATLRARATVADAAENPSEKADFIADILTVTVTRPDGTVVMEAEMEPRGFKAKEVKSGPTKGQMLGGVGWYAAVTAKEGGAYDDFPLQAGLRISLDGVKLNPSDSLNLIESGDSDGE